MAWSRILENTDVTDGTYSSAAYRITEGKTFSVFCKGDITGTVEVLVFGTNYVEPDPSDDRVWTVVDRDFLDSDDPYYYEGKIDTMSHIYVQVKAPEGSFLNGYIRIMSK